MITKITVRGALRASQATALLCAALAVTAAWRRIHTPDAPITQPTWSSEPAPLSAIRRSLSDAELAGAVESDPFSTDRAAPQVRYRIAGVPGQQVVAVSAPPVRLLGTVVSPEGRSFAMCQIGTDAPRSVHAGQMIGTLKLQSVSQGSAIFTDVTGARVTLRMPTGGN